MAKETKAQKQKLIDEMLREFKAAGVGNPVTKAELWEKLKHHGKQESLDRRIRYLREKGWQVPYNKKSNSYTLASLTRNQVADTDPIPRRMWTEVMVNADGTCGMCGKTVKGDKIKLDADHRTPRRWGGKTELENLWAICQQCNIRKKDLFASQDQNLMKRCMAYTIPEQRLGELLKAFNGKLVPRRLLEFVGKQEQWTRRIRTLRQLGWKVPQVRDPAFKGRYAITYRLEESKPWPKDLGAAIRAANKKVKPADDEDDD